ncbi:MAG TPA: efflux RND transporter periplasmic adaptor subunit [Burkholderiaceae bacterium]|nr:efflux RND transporter periplasmic adaptor subunit [Burkholderiaceae bacterium]
MSTRHNIILTGLAALVVAGLVTYRAGAAPKASKASGGPSAVQVDVATVINRPIIDWHEYSGRLQAVDNVQIRPQVSGTITAVRFKDGALVKKGDVLFIIDPRPYVAAVDRARADVVAAQASVAYTASDERRGQRLLAENAIARRDVEAKRNAAREAAAKLQAAKATLESAELDLEHTKITAPISGRASRANVTVGNVVSASAAPALTSLVSVSHLYAAFDMDERGFLTVSAELRAPGAQAPMVQLRLADEKGYPHKGKLVFIDNQLNPSSGTILARALFNNPDGALVPGLYARLRVEEGAQHPAVLIDQTAIGTDQDKRFVLLVDAKNHVQYRQVRLGGQYDGLQIIDKGLAPGDRIVVNGLQRVRPGMSVAPHIVAMAAPPALAVADIDGNS